ncbi:MAG: glycosyltransferase family protein [Thermodesulfobacteriota bacterium]
MEAFETLGHKVFWNIWEMKKIKEHKIEAVVFETKQILKREIKFLILSLWMQRHKVIRITWCVDWPNVGASAWKMQALQRLPLLDIFASHDVHGLQSSKMKIIYLPNAAWTSKYNLGDHSLQEMRDPSFYYWDVSFLGNLDHTAHPEHRARVNFLRKLAKILEKEKINYRFCDSRFMSYQEQVEIIQRSRINLNVGCAADGQREKSWGLPERCYGVPACGGFLLSEERVCADIDFSLGNEIVTFKNLRDCVEKIKYYIGNISEARRIAENAYGRVLAQHTYVHRAETLIKCIEDFK